MHASSRDRITVDMRGLKAALEDQARRLGLAPSEFVRATLARVLISTNESNPRVSPCRNVPSDRVRWCLRVRRSERDQLQRAARQAGLGVGDLLLGLLERSKAVDLRDSALLVEALTASNAELAALSRSLSHLTNLLGQGSVRAALVYRESLERVHGQVGAHLKLAAAALSDLQPLVRLGRRRRFSTEVHHE